MTTPRQRPSARQARSGVAFGIAALVLVGYATPLLGPLVCLGLPFLTHSLRRRLWPEASIGRSIAWSLLAWVGLWLPGLVGLFTQVFSPAGVEVSTSWLLIPLCAPQNIGAVLLPAMAAALTCLAGLMGAVRTRRGWWWVAAAWLAPWVHSLVFSRLPHEFFC